MLTLRPNPVVMNPLTIVNRAMAKTVLGGLLVASVMLMSAPVAASCPASMAGAGMNADPCQITTRAQLEAVATSLNSAYRLMNDIDLMTTPFTPIGTEGSPFTGSFDGYNKTLSNLTINLPSTNYVGLFGRLSDADLADLTLLNVSITGQRFGRCRAFGQRIALGRRSQWPTSDHRQ